MGVLSSCSTISTWQLKLRGDDVNNVIYAPSHPYRPEHLPSAATVLKRIWADAQDYLSLLKLDAQVIAWRLY